MPVNGGQYQGDIQCSREENNNTMYFHALWLISAEFENIWSLISFNSATRPPVNYNLLFFITFCFILDRISSVWAAAFINLSINFLQYFLDYLLFAQEISILVHNSLLLLHPSKIAPFYLISLSAEITANLFWNCLWCVQYYWHF